MELENRWDCICLGLGRLLHYPVYDGRNESCAHLSFPGFLYIADPDDLRLNTEFTRRRNRNQLSSGHVLRSKKGKAFQTYIVGLGLFQEGMSMGIHTLYLDGHTYLKTKKLPSIQIVHIVLLTVERGFLVSSKLVRLYYDVWKIEEFFLESGKRFHFFRSFRLDLNIWPARCRRFRYQTGADTKEGL